MGTLDQQSQLVLSPSIGLRPTWLRTAPRTHIYKHEILRPTMRVAVSV